MNAAELFREGRLDQAIEALGAEVRNDPTDARRRTFLFELLCFAGSYDRAEKQLGVLAGNGRDAEMGALLYHGALHAERTRQQMFGPAGLPPTTATPRAVSGTLNGREFSSLTDADPRIGARLELFAAGQYTWLPFDHIASITMEAPKRLRDLLWSTAIVRPAAAFSELELGEVLMPALTPLAWTESDDAIRLGRITEWRELDDGQAAPAGQKLLLVDDEEFPILELRELVIHPSAPDA